MAYTINLTDGAIFATIPDGTIDTSSSMILVGKNYAGYGEFLDENFIHLLENGANNVPPSAPLIGQLWWDKSTNTMRVYNGTVFKVISGATASQSAPTSNVPGDLWWDTLNGQLKVWNGSNFTLIGPASSGPGVSGAIVTTITDNVAVPHVVVQFFVDNTIVGMVSKDATFTPQTPIPGFAQIAPGIQLSTSVPNALFRGTAVNANTLETLAASAFMRTNQNTTTTGTLAVLNDTGLSVGIDQDARISVTTATSEVIVDNQTSNANLSLRVNPAGSPTTVMRALGTTGEVTFPAPAGVNVTGSITVPQILKSGANNSGNIGSSTNVFNTVFANTFQGTVSTATNVSGTVAVPNGGTGRNTLNAGAVLLGNGTGNVNFVAPGTDGNVLTASGGVWVSQAGGGGGGGSVTSVTAAAGSPITVINTTTTPVVGITSPIPVANGGTGGSSFTSNAVLLGNGAGQFQIVSPGTNGNVLTASGGTWISQAASGGSSTSIVNGTSNVTVVSSGGIIRANVGGTTIQTISNTGITVSGTVSALGQVSLDSGNLRGMSYNPGTDIMGVGVSGGLGLILNGSSPTGNLDIIAGNVTTSANIVAGSFYTPGTISLGVSSPGAGLVNNTSVSPNELGLGYSGVNGMTIQNQANGTILFTSDNIFKPTAGPFLGTSDQRLKTNIRDYTVGLADVMALRPRRYDLLDRHHKVKYGVDRVQTKDAVGLMAQEVLETELEDMVSEAVDGYYNIDVSNVTWALVNAVKELKQEIDQLRSELQELRSAT